MDRYFRNARLERLFFEILRENRGSTSRTGLRLSARSHRRSPCFCPYAAGCSAHEGAGKVGGFLLFLVLAGVSLLHVL